MKSFPTEFIVPDGMKLQDIKTQLMDRASFSENSEQTISRTCMDSFDWLIYQAGGLIEEQSNGQRRHLIWHDLGTGLPLFRQKIDTASGFAWDLPPGSLRERLSKTLEMRTLLPLVRITSHIQTLCLLNNDEKTVLRLLLEANRYLSMNGEREGKLAARVSMQPVKGYDKPVKQIGQYLEELGLEPVQSNLLIEGLAASGRTPLDYSSKLNYQLNPDMRADEATKEILLGLLKTLEANVQGTQANLDSEFLHDLRVATRRTRSALTQIKGVFDSEVVEDYKTRFAWVQQITGQVRDLDVYLLSFEDYRQSLPEPMRPHLDPMREFLVSHYDGEQKAMVRKLNSPHFRTLLKAWRNFLATPVPQYSSAPNAMRPIKTVADKRIRSMYRRVRKEGLAIGPDSPPEELHELRKSCKKLRYLMEFFQSLYASDEIRSLIKILKVLLDNLGNFQDLATQAHNLRHIAQQMVEEGTAPTDALLAMGMLVGDLLNRQQQTRLEFSQIFAEFDQKQNRQLFKSLFVPATG